MTRPDFEIAMKKGNAGEDIVKAVFEREGWIIYRPETAGAHHFDMMAIKNKKTAIAVDVKTKARMNFFPATGVNQIHFEEYERFSKKHQMPFWIIFVDERLKKIYGNTISELEKRRLVDGNAYPMVKNFKGTAVRLWPLAAMKDIARIDDNTADVLTSYSQRNYGYESEGWS